MGLELFVTNYFWDEMMKKILILKKNSKIVHRNSSNITFVIRKDINCYRVVIYI